MLLILLAIIYIIVAIAIFVYVLLNGDLTIESPKTDEERNIQRGTQPPPHHELPIQVLFVQLPERHEFQQM